jgi:hypothetical protein
MGEHMDGLLSRDRAVRRVNRVRRWDQRITVSFYHSLSSIGSTVIVAEASPAGINTVPDRV